MQHITNRYGSEANLLLCSMQEYKAIESFLSKIGVETRFVSIGKEGVTFQARNNFRDNILLHQDRLGSEILELTKKEISDGYYKR